MIKETDSTPSQMSTPETLNPVIGDGCAIPMTSSSVSYTRASVSLPWLRFSVPQSVPQNLGTDGDFLQAVGVVVDNQARIIVGVIVGNQARIIVGVIVGNQARIIVGVIVGNQARIIVGVVPDF